ncbi:MAG: helix-turn-helix domain-containing protein [Microbacteriaceae bacterium]|nr:helix-turn-helix domain-containing protein [Microbacteriaceae bacterium]
MTEEQATLEVDVPPRELFLIPEEVAAQLGASVRELRRLRDTGAGPAYFTIGTAIRYLPADVDQWRSEHPEGLPLPRPLPPT